MRCCMKISLAEIFADFPIEYCVRGSRALLTLYAVSLPSSLPPPVRRVRAWHMLLL